MLNTNQVLLKLIERYDYGGVFLLLNDLHLENTDVSHLVKSCRYAINFDFDSARLSLNLCSSTLKAMPEFKPLEENLKALTKGEPEDMFSELMENLKIKLINEEYIDFLGRVYRLKEAILKYIFVKIHTDRTKFSMNVITMSKRYQLKVLRKKYKIFNGNLEYALTTYLNKYQRDDYKVTEVVRILNSERMTSLVDLRNDTIVGHGFTGVSRDDITRVYGNPYNVLDDFRVCLEKLEFSIYRYKYSEINEWIIKLAEQIKQDEPIVYKTLNDFEK